jgi:hypothetical protein
VPKLFSKMVTLRVEDSVKRKTLQLQSCREFHGKHSEHKIHLIPSLDGRVRPELLRPRWGDGNPRDYIKGGTLARGGHLHLRICSHQSHVFASPMDPISMGEGSHEAMKEGGLIKSMSSVSWASHFMSPKLQADPSLNSWLQVADHTSLNDFSSVYQSLVFQSLDLN